MTEQYVGVSIDTKEEKSSKLNRAKQYYISFEERKQQLIKEKEYEKELNKRKHKSPFSLYCQVNYNQHLFSLCAANPSACTLFLFLLNCIDRKNCVMISYDTIQKVLGVSKSTVTRNIQYLKKYKYIAIIKQGTSNLYVINPYIAWRNGVDKLKTCPFPNLEKPILPKNFKKYPYLRSCRGEKVLPKKETTQPKNMFESHYDIKTM